MCLNEPVGQKDNGNKEHHKAEDQRRKCMGKRNLELSSWDSQARTESILSGSRLP